MSPQECSICWSCHGDAKADCKPGELLLLPAHPSLGTRLHSLKLGQEGTVALDKELLLLGGGTRCWVA